MEETRFATVPQIVMSGVPQVRVGVVGYAMRLVGITHIFVQFKNNCTRNSQFALGFASCNYLTVTGMYNYAYRIELKQISESVGYPFEIHYPDSDPEPFRIVANYFKKF